MHGWSTDHDTKFYLTIHNNTLLKITQIIASKIKTDLLGMYVTYIRTALLPIMDVSDDLCISFNSDERGIAKISLCLPFANLAMQV